MDKDRQNRQTSQEHRRWDEESDPLALVILPPLQSQSPCFEEPLGKTWSPRACLALMELGLIADTAWGPEDSYQDQVRKLWLSYHRQQSPNPYVEEARKMAWGRRGDDGARMVLTIKEQQDLWNSILKVKVLWEGCRNEQAATYPDLYSLLKPKVCTTCTGARPTPSGDSHRAQTECLNTASSADAAGAEFQRPVTSQQVRGICSVGDAAGDESSDDLYSELTTDRDDDVASYDDSDYDTWTDNDSVPDSEDSRRSSEVEQRTVKENTFTFPHVLGQGCEPWVQLSGCRWSRQMLPVSSSTSTMDGPTPTPSVSSSQEKKSKASTPRPTICTAGSLVRGMPSPVPHIQEQRHHPHHQAPKQAKTGRPAASSASYVQTNTWPAPPLQRITYLPTPPSYAPASVMVFQKCPPPQTIPQGYIHHLAASPIPVLPPPPVGGFVLPPIPMVRTQPPPAFFVPPSGSVTVMKSTSRIHPSAWNVGSTLPPPPQSSGGGLHHPHHHANKLPTPYGKYGAQRASFPSYPQGTGESKNAKHRQLRKNRREASSQQDGCPPTCQDANR